MLQAQLNGGLGKHLTLSLPLPDTVTGYLTESSKRIDVSQSGDSDDGDPTPNISSLTLCCL